MFIRLTKLLATLVLPQDVDVLTLERALTRANAGRPRLAAARAAVDRARGSARMLTAIPNPAAQFERDELAPTQKAVATQALGWLPRYMADRATGVAVVDRARADSMQVAAEVAREVRRAFFGSLAAQEQLALAVEQRALADSLTRFAERRVDAGEISGLERDQIALEASRARLVAAQADESARVATVELARVVVWDRGPPPRASGALDMGLSDGAVLPATPAAVEDAPTVRAAVADAAGADARLTATQIGRIPIPGLFIGREWGPAGQQGNSILGFTLTIPLWTQGFEAANQARGAAAEQSALAAEARLTTRSAIETARLRVDASMQRARFARDSLLPEARRVRAGAVRLYETGRTSVIPVLDALRAERDVARAAVAELLGFQQAVADLAAVLGKTR